MLDLINNFAPFFEDCYRRISVREYAGIVGISPPTASKLLKEYNKKGFLKKFEERRHLFFHLDNENRDAIDLCRIYWRKKLSRVCEELQKIFVNPAGVLFGSAAKAELKKDSDIDIAVFAAKEKKIDLKSYEEKMKRGISVYQFRSVKSIKNVHLRNNIINGYVLFGRPRWD